MCIGTPMQIVALESSHAVCGVRGRSERVDLALVGDQAVGAWVLVHCGMALRAISPDEAEQTLAALDALDAVLAGEGDVDRFFTDLTSREPTLPAHLRKETQS